MMVVIHHGSMKSKLSMNNNRTLKIELTKFQALYIKLLRERYNCTWRSVAVHFEHRYNLDTFILSGNKGFYSSGVGLTFGGNQIIGMLLCRDAALLLNEKWD